MSAFKTDKTIIRDYITAMDHLQYSQLPEDIVAITLTHSNLSAKHVDLRINLHLTIQAVKERFYTHIGTPPEHQRLILRQEGRDICELRDNSKMFGFYSPISGMEVHCIDTDPYSLSRGGGLTDTTLVEKYRLSDEAYSKRPGTMREYIQKQRQLDPNFKLGAKKAAKSEEEESGPPPGLETVEGIVIGARCQIMPGSRRGTVAWVGELEHLKPGYWVGIRFDEPVGKSDGTVRGVQVFECEPSFGGFVRGKNVTVGDFPERDLMDESDGDGDQNHECTGSKKGSSCCAAGGEAEEEDEDEI